MTRTDRRARNQGGVTLIELLVVLAIIAVAAALIAPSFTAPIRRPEPDIAGFLKQMRVRALTSGRPVAIHVTANGLRAEDGSAQTDRSFTLPADRSLVLTWPPDAQKKPAPRLTVFYPDGTAVFTRLTVHRAGRDPGATTPLYSLTIDPVHGDIAHAYR